MTKPNFIIVGVARCGTTSLYHYLSQHPKINFSKNKEPKYFSSINKSFPQKGIGDHFVDDKMVKNREEYLKLFENFNSDFPIGEASSDYFYYHKQTIPLILSELGDIPIIISIRNPIERSFSAYNNLVRDNREVLSFSEASEKEEERINENWDWMWAYKKGSLYAEGIKAFQDNFSNVKVVLFDDIEENPQKVVDEIFDFLKVEKIKIDSSVKYSPSGKPKNSFIKLISNRNNIIITSIRTFIIKVIPRSFLENIAKNFFKKEEIPSQEKQELFNFFKEDISEVERLLSINLDNWKLK